MPGDRDGPGCRGHRGGGSGWRRPWQWRRASSGPLGSERCRGGTGPSPAPPSPSARIARNCCTTWMPAKKTVSKKMVGVGQVPCRSYHSRLGPPASLLIPIPRPPTPSQNPHKASPPGAPQAPPSKARHRAPTPEIRPVGAARANPHAGPNPQSGAFGAARPNPHAGANPHPAPRTSNRPQCPSRRPWPVPTHQASIIPDRADLTTLG